MMGVTTFNTKQMESALSIYSKALVGAPVNLQITNAQTAMAWEESNPTRRRSKQVIIPSADWSKKENREIGEGQTVHESLHHVYTEFDSLSNLTRDRYFRLRKGFANSIEDVFIEFMGEQKWPGVRKIMERRLIIGQRRGWFPKVEDVTSIQAVELYYFYELRIRRLNNPLHKKRDEYKAVAEKTLGKANFAELQQFIDQGMMVRSSYATVRLANNIVDWLVNLQSDEQSDEQSGEQSDEQSGEQSGEQSDEQSGEQSGEQSDEQSGEQSGEQSDEQSGDFSEQDKEDLLGEMSNHRSSPDLSTKAIEHLESERVDTPSIVPPGVHLDAKKGHPISQEWKSDIRRLQSRLTRPLEAMIKAKTWAKNTFSNRGDLDTSRLIRVLTDGKAMKQETVTVGANSAVSLLVDMSGSMAQTMNNGKRLAETAETAMAGMMLALEKLKVNSSAYRYSGSWNDDLAYICPYKKFNEKTSEIITRLGVDPFGSTPTAEAIMGILPEITRQKEDKKILYVITDGDADDQDSLEQSYNLAIQLGVNIKFILIGFHWRSSFALEDVYHIDDVAELAAILQKLSLKNI